VIALLDVFQQKLSMPHYYSHVQYVHIFTSSFASYHHTNFVLGETRFLKSAMEFSPFFLSGEQISSSCVSILKHNAAAKKSYL
jgi:hypothetical protein